MSFDAIESSVNDGRPIFGYRFTLGTTVWRYTSAVQDYVYDGITWKAIPISDDGTSQTGEAQADALTITAPATIGPVSVHFTTPPGTPIQVEIYRTHIGDVDAEAVVVYSGEITQISFTLAGQAKITCETTSASMRRDGLRLGYQVGCPFAVYDPLTCKVDKDDFAVELRILSIDGFTVTVDAADTFDDGYFSGGFIQWLSVVRGVEHRMIESHTGNTFLMFGMTDDLFEGLSVIAYPGCDRTEETCASRFNNLVNNGGFKYMPGKSPYDGDPVFV